ncbi:protein serine/threonine phosphatase 2C [Morchella conica CCBAS932]|uniref:Protein serine/threonine phosphatase 2C n=1 Tax=Morchella conica CCBAS932 TaxID=1392247 RepID=A0A3N4KBD6_9PEZI|nr:protein serine/threonine phosphatase 2C [Morchella conica CCBAS932]
MKPKQFTIALLSGLVLAGAWYYKDSISASLGNSSPLSPSSPSSSPRPVVSQPQHQSFSTSAVTPAAAASKASEEPKKVILIDNESLYTGTLPAGEKVSKEVDNSGRKIVEMLSPEQATEKLRRNEESYIVGRGRGVWRYDVVQVPSNDPIEDDHDEKIIEVPQTVVPVEGQPSSDWMFWGVFDGHSGWTTSAKLRQALIVMVARELNETYKAALTDPSATAPTSEAVDAAIKKGFLRLDNEIVNESVEKVFKNPSKLVAAETLAPALSGSCGLLAFYESHSKQLKIAVTGDSRAVLGRRGANGKWTATALSEDQTGSNREEEARMRAEHPGEEHVIRNGRVLGGLEPTRAFGDAFYKWSIETQLKIKKEFFGRTPSTLLKTPPYVTAEPVVTTTQIEPDKGDFLVLATDGLWEMLTNEEVVGLVGRWIEEQQEGATKSGKPWFGGLFGGKDQGALPVEGEATDATGQRQPIRIRQWGVTAKESERFVWEDRNAATHVVRNAMGGKNKDQLSALLTLPSPYSRRYRDDLTVEVIFFGNGTDKSGKVTINEEATAIKSKGEKADEKAGDVKAKL